MCLLRLCRQCNYCTTGMHNGTCSFILTLWLVRFWYVENIWERNIQCKYKWKAKDKECYTLLIKIFIIYYDKEKSYGKELFKSVGWRTKRHIQGIKKDVKLLSGWGLRRGFLAEEHGLLGLMLLYIDAMCLYIKVYKHTITGECQECF